MDNLNKLIFKAKGADTCPDGEVWTEKKEKKILLGFQSGILQCNWYFIEEAFKSHTASFIMLFTSTWTTLADIATQGIQLLRKCLLSN